MKYLLLISALVPSLVFAQLPSGCELSNQDNDSVFVKNLRLWLKEKKFTMLERELNNRLTLYERGEYSDLAIRRDIRYAVLASPSSESPLVQWVTENPKSFFAHVMKGEYHADAGYSKRGSAAISKTSEEQIADMRIEHSKAIKEFKLALELRPNSAIPRAGLINVLRPFAGADSINAAISEAEKVDPKNMVVRGIAVNTLVPRWGNEFTAQDRLLERAQKSGVSDDNLRYLRYEIDMSRASHYQIVTEEHPKAIDYFRSAVRICPTAQAWDELGRSARKLSDWPLLKEAAIQSSMIKPGVGWVVQVSAFASEKLGRLDESAKEYAKAAELGMGYSQMRYGLYFMNGNGPWPKDLSKAKKWLDAAIASGDPSAKNYIVEVNNALNAK